MTDTTTDRIITTGDNRPPALLPKLLDADDLLLQLGIEHQPTADNVTKLLAEIRDEAPAVVETDADNGIVAAFMERLRSTIKHIETNRVGEKAPYLKAERACDQYFSGMGDRLAKARDILQARGDKYTARKVAEERAERNRIAAAAAKAADDARRETARLAQEAADKLAAAERARKPENVAKLTTAAETVGAQASMAQVDEMIANSAAENANLATMAKSADIARTRHETGHMSTAKQVPVVKIVDTALLDLNTLRPFIKEDELLKALKAWAKVTGYKKEMDGAIIGMRDAGDYR